MRKLWVAGFVRGAGHAMIIKVSGASESSSLHRLGTRQFQAWMDQQSGKETM
jgi:hypothetical protein